MQTLQNIKYISEDDIMDNNKYSEACRLIDAGKATGMHAKVIAPSVAKVLKLFAESEPEFAEAIIAKGEKGFDECLKAIVTNVGGSISDIEAYRRAVNFYFPGAGVRFVMKIDLCASANGEKDILPGGLGFESMSTPENPESSSSQSALQSAGTPDNGTAKSIELDLDSLFD